VNDFDKAMEFVFQWEGGYSIDPDDLGGETKYGISKRAYPSLSIKDLTVDQAKDIYLMDYWHRAGCISMVYPLNIVMMDTAVNMGVGGAKRLLAKTASDNPIDKADELIASRELRYKRIADLNPSQKKFLKGWLNRTTALRTFVGL